MLKVSFVLPVKNGEKFLRHTVESLQKQTLVDIEIVIVNDHSTDNTQEIIEELAKIDSRITVHKLTETSGVAAGRNAGTNIARGEIILPTDADDPNYPNRAEVSVKELERNNADIYYGNVKRHYIETCKDELRHFQPYNARLLSFVNFIANSASAYKKSVFEDVGGYDTKIKIGEDYDFWLSAQEKGYKFCSQNTPLTQYTMHSGQTTGQNLSPEKIAERQKWNQVVREKHRIFDVDVEYVKQHASPEVVDFYVNKNYDIWFAPKSIPEKTV